MKRSTTRFLLVTTAVTALSGCAMMRSERPQSLPTPQYADVCVGEGHTVALRAPSKFVAISPGLMGWGSNTHGQLNLDDPTAGWPNQPVEWSPLDPGPYPTVLSCNAERTFVSRKKGGGYRLASFGFVFGYYGGKTFASYRHSSSLDLVSVGREHDCGIVAHYIYCRGEGDSGRLGYGGTGDMDAAFVDLPMNELASDVAAGGAHTCAVAVFDRETGKGGEVFCWGRNTKGEVGLTAVGSQSLKPVQVPGLQAIDVAAGDSHSCAVLTDGTVRCWGSKVGGQLGNGDTSLPETKPSTTSPIQVSNITNAYSISAQGNSTCALLADGAVWCWGSNELGQLAQDPVTTPRVPTPMKIEGLPAAAKIAVGRTHSCAIAGPDSTLWCWGQNTNGMLADGTTINSWTPVTPP